MLILPSEVRLIEMLVAFVALYLTIFYILLYIKYRMEIKSSPEDKGYKPKLSVVIPAYNEAKEIPKCIESILALNYPKDKIEIIVVDDGSKDNTLEIAQGYEKLGVKVFTKKNEGTAAATKNYGIKKATGDIIATLDGDSYVHPEAVNNMINYFNDDSVMAVTACIKAYSRKGTNLLTSVQRVEYIFTLFSRKILSSIEAVNVTPGPFSMFRKEVFEKIGYFDVTNILEDQEFAMRMQKNNMRIKSSMNAEVYTDVPFTFRELLKQRTRWHRGGLHNSLKYLELIGPRYGDMGIIVMPLTLVAILLLFIVFVMVGLYVMFPSPYLYALGVNSLLLNVHWITFVGLSVFALNFLWIYKGIQYFKEEKVTLFEIIIYVIAYSYLVTIYWISALLKEITREKMSW